MSERRTSQTQVTQRPSPPRERQSSPFRSGSPSRPCQTQPQPQSSTHSRTSSQTPRPDPTQDVLTAGDGLASSLGVSPPKTTSHLAAAATQARRRSSPTYDLSGTSAQGKQGPAEGLTGFDSTAGYQDSGSGGAFTASGAMEVVPMNAPALMYDGGRK
ncbi:hypothetical protein CcaverHIS002_0405850 [Cutaneotrichosporon cavernicola]|uniref:Uncharacterized protein n=1 Tax=Cutaneotrichosporon cavernicola TaxID=279322 RepID=A0AA48L4G3_9TREE|nr:uncharacterized protein CcaverHIS019_0405850 [Cutaneotrichosporon cavernicola]BEI83981.1 hypothetical protein CcaverHIS002_0405850 [Cutaneotrichosporon cavernicola]BEI91765.1 hypothetical protein CcaverHIS019_0405850 [Cutaneotrichosporon cavernicola]BEI99537.1 hypothetical protein CcaverHIS631_0405800 [Cutaneotrichosporon cavernicola]BEJ07314.1 hypothetical protein CcaverHIS641_0405830 [Cutaneotrichosporon cavernicola]